jgi:beta-glucosidase
VTFSAADDQYLAAQDPRRYPGMDGVVRCEEELRVGYRWWQPTSEVPLFPFGPGLSYPGSRKRRARGRTVRAAEPRTRMTGLEEHVGSA